MTFDLLFVILGATHGSAPKGFAPIAIRHAAPAKIPVTGTA
jgi:hypothetical protein